MSEQVRWSTPSPVPDTAPSVAPEPSERDVAKPGRRAGLERFGARDSWTWPAAVYLASRLVLLVVAAAVSLSQHRSLVSELTLFDGQWYLRLARFGYPARSVHVQSTLGFLPLYPLVIRAVAWTLSLSYVAAALIISFIGGLVAVVVAQRLATSWWGGHSGRKAALAFALFPGSIVFSMAYSECLTIPLALGCLLALRSRRWLLAGLLAGVASAVEPVALALVPVCLFAAARQVRLQGWRSPAARRSLAAPLLSPLGLGAFAVFLWTWTGTPFATLEAQHYGWHHPSQPLAIFSLPITRHLLSHLGALMRYVLTWNPWNGVAGGIFLVFSLLALWHVRHEVGSETFLYVAGVALLTLWSVMTLPNARMLLVASPAVLVWARRLPPPRWRLFLGAEAVMFVLMSSLTLSGHMLP
ncbi:MAG: hypothetical protein ACYCVV_15230 [Acidimicrobiales bacterium]